ncbi:MAG: hypothetical protein AAB473_00950 [Patescibacteria group bacterium]
MHEPSRHTTSEHATHAQISVFTTDDAHPDSIDHLDELGNTARSSRTTDDLGNMQRNTRRDSSPDDRRDPDFGYGGGNSDLF